ncbi:MAG TPA: response regulator [Pyrinomonadaceae bacterium]|nr:response regulator [Pyrinomonadaceae bacterium]
MNNKILCVDDDRNILEGYRRTLRKDFNIHIAEGGAQALAEINENGPFAVIVSDMRMPGMDGIQFLSRVKEIAPESIRLMLTGNSDQQTAINAVNEGNIFRFLTKPCPPELLAKALTAGLEQYRLVTAEKQLLEQTLNNSLQVMVDILAMINETAFSRSTRVKKMAREIAERLKVQNIWEVEIAAMLSQIGCITVPEEILQKISKGEKISDNEARLFLKHPKIGCDLIGQIPRMEKVAEIIANQNKRFIDESGLPEQSNQTDKIRVGEQILKVVLDFDKLRVSGYTLQSAFRKLVERIGWYNPLILNCLKDLIEGQVEEYKSIELDISNLKPGMILENSLVSKRGSLLLSPGQEISLTMIMRLKNFVEEGLIDNKFLVSSVVENDSLMELSYSI